MRERKGKEKRVDERNDDEMRRLRNGEMQGEERK